ncbi:hypothetical protein RCL_jg19487.t1 [Rhizophagus clarus]|uniref:Uncharacterized protein n=1 Tax=Rhizophagus clarus TaxID=94130 RepID=A0A8H3QLW4_9GLOM|nr:hypothetical protein RCL_jg19487.t1 [Rhizophagus clarus]
MTIGTIEARKYTECGDAKKKTQRKKRRSSTQKELEELDRIILILLRMYTFISSRAQFGLFVVPRSTLAAFRRKFTILKVKRGICKRTTNVRQEVYNKASCLSSIQHP